MKLVSSVFKDNVFALSIIFDFKCLIKCIYKSLRLGVYNNYTSVICEKNYFGFIICDFKYVIKVD